MLNLIVRDGEQPLFATSDAEVIRAALVALERRLFPAEAGRLFAVASKRADKNDGDGKPAA